MRFLVLLCLLSSFSSQAQESALKALDPAQRVARQAADMRAILTYRAGLAQTLEFMRERPALFPEQQVGRRLLPEADKRVVRDVWRRMLDYQLALEALQRFHGDFYRIGTRAAREQSLAASYAAFLARYRHAMEFIERIENDPEFAKVLNEPMDEFGGGRNSYDQFKFAFLNVGIASQFAALTAVHKISSSQTALDPAIAEDKRRIWDMGQGKGEALTLANAWNVTKKLTQRVTFPVQAGVSEWMGDTKVLKQNQSLISATQIADMIPRMQPGDVMLQRREWYVSNVGLPGFWSHAALYVGTPEERRAYFSDAETRDWVRRQGIADGDFEKLLMRQSANHALSVTAQEHGHLPRVLEAISEGVSFTTLEHSAAADSLVVLRPRLSKADKAFALLRAFGYALRPYDFDFDFQTDDKLVCTELVYKAYEPTAERKGIRLKLDEIVGRLATPANGIAQQFDADYGGPAQQWDMVLFLDGAARQKKAIESDVAAFRGSWQRPKWHVLLPETKQTQAAAAR